MFLDSSFDRKGTILFKYFDILKTFLNRIRRINIYKYPPLLLINNFIQFRDDHDS